jgi:hypothetical protein
VSLGIARRPDAVVAAALHELDEIDRVGEAAFDGLELVRK